MRAVRLLCSIVLLAWLAPAYADDSPELLLEVRLDQHLLADGIGAYEQAGEVLLPLGELARLLTLAIDVDPAAGKAGGYILNEARGFSLDVERQLVVRGGAREHVDAALVRRRADDIYVAASLLARWLPVAVRIDRASLSLTLHAHEKLPVQARLERQGKLPAGAQGHAAEPGYPLVATPYRLARMPFADQTVGFDLGRNRQGHHAASYTAYVTGDLLGAEAALYLNHGQYATGPAARLTLARHDPGAALLGALKARTVEVGSVSGAGVANIALGGAIGNGVLVSNRALGLPARFDHHTLQGDLPPGWDVELYFNEALVGYQQARADGRYRFEDQVLIYGANDFRLVFHGPLGQTHVERYRFLLEQSMLAPGQFDYSASVQRDDQGRARSALLFDWGLGKRLAASAALLRLPLQQQRLDQQPPQRSYASIGLQAYLDRLIVSVSAARADDGGSLAQVGVKTRIGALALAASHAATRNFTSEFYLPTPDPVRSRDELRADGMLGAQPVMLQARRDHLASGLDLLELSARVSSYRAGTALSHLLRWQSLGGSKHADGQLAASARMAGLGISGQLQYTIEPRTALTSVALAADKHLAGGYLASAAVTRTFVDSHYRFSATLNKSMGRFGMGVSGWYSTRGEYGAGVQLFMALGQEPRSAAWISDAAPMAGSGSASLRVFLDDNRNGVMDADDVPLAGAGFLVNGAPQLARSGADGVAWIGRLVPHQYADITLDPATLEDPQWQPLVKGVRVVPRPGSVGQLDFAVVVNGEIDGTCWLLDGGARRPAGDLELELVDARQAVVGQARSGADGYFLLAGVAPGAYRLRVAPAQLQRLGLRAPPPRDIHMDDQANLASGQDIVLARGAP
jgi:hypothetical protein